MCTIRAALCLFLLALAPARAAEVIEVRNPFDPPLERTVVYDEVWRAGDDENAEYLFGVIMDVDEDADGNIYLLDTQQQELHKFDAEGHWLGRIARRGQGPGEIDNVYQFRTLGDGRIGLLKVVPSRLIRITTDGLPLDGLAFEPAKPDEPIRWGSLYSFESGGNALYAEGSFMLADSFPGAGLDFVASFDADGVEIHRFGEHRGGYDFSRPIRVDELERYYPCSNWDVDRRGRIYHTVERESYLIEVRGADGALVGRIGRDWETHRRTDQEKEEAKNRFSFASNRDLPPISYDMADTDPAITALEVIGDELWVSDPVHTRQAKRDGTKIVDVFDLGGRLIERRTLVYPFDRDRDAIHVLDSGRIVRVKNYRSATLSAQPDVTTQRGDQRVDATAAEDDILLEVIVYAPRRE